MQTVGNDMQSSHVLRCDHAIPDRSGVHWRRRLILLPRNIRRGGHAVPRVRPVRCSPATVERQLQPARRGVPVNGVTDGVGHAK